MTLTLTLTPEKERLLQEQAQEVGLPMEEYVQQVVDQLIAPEPKTSRPDVEEAEQARLRAIMAELQAQARALVPERAEGRAAAQSNPVVEAVADKFRRQGFNL